MDERVDEVGVLAEVEVENKEDGDEEHFFLDTRGWGWIYRSRI